MDVPREDPASLVDETTRPVVVEQVRDVLPVRGDHHLEHVPVVGIASKARHEVTERARSLGLSDVVLKFDRPGLIEAITEAIDSRELAA